MGKIPNIDPLLDLTFNTEGWKRKTLQDQRQRIIHALTHQGYSKHQAELQAESMFPTPTKWAPGERKNTPFQSKLKDIASYKRLPPALNELLNELIDDSISLVSSGFDPHRSWGDNYWKARRMVSDHLWDLHLQVERLDLKRKGILSAQDTMRSIQQCNSNSEYEANEYNDAIHSLTIESGYIITKLNHLLRQYTIQYRDLSRIIGDSPIEYGESFRKYHERAYAWNPKA